MEPLLIFAFILIIGAVIVVAAISENKKENARSEALNQKAQRFKMTYFPKDERNLKGVYEYFKLFRKGRQAYLSNQIIRLSLYSKYG